MVIENGDRIPEKGIGYLKLYNKSSKAFMLPNFTSNLLSVKRATTDLNCYTIIGPNSVYFQDIEMEKLLGEGNSKGDLYVLENKQPSNSTSFSFNSHCALSSNAVWHARVNDT